MRIIPSLLFSVLVLSLSCSQGADAQSQGNVTISDFHPRWEGCSIATNGLSPNGQYAFVLTPSKLEPNEDEYVGLSGLMIRSQPGKFFYAVGLPPEGSLSFGADRSENLSIIRWAKDSSAFVVFDNRFVPEMSRAVFSIYVVPMIKGEPAKATDLSIEILKSIDENFVKAHAKEINEHSSFFGEINDDGLEDNLTFNRLNQLVVDCLCTNCIPGDDSYVGWTVRFRGLWDPIRRKFVKEHHAFIRLANWDNKK